MTEMLHEVVAKRESKVQRGSITEFREMLEQVGLAYRQSHAPDTRGINAIDMVMRSRDNISIGSTINMPMLDMSSPANAELITQYTVYTYTGAAIGTYRGWVRTN
jgi:hypothetical protein